MIDMDAYYWSAVLQPAIHKENMEGGIPWCSIDDYLGASGHEFTDHRRSDYRFRLFFDNPENELAFRLRYKIK